MQFYHLSNELTRSHTCNCKKGSDWLKRWMEAQVANHHQTETPERAGGRTKINSDCDQFQI